MLLESEGYGKGKMKKVELLAPAGNYESFLGAVHAGADAVYLGGAKFGARAYAENFTKEEICRAIRYAHIYKRKVYLTLNTLVKEREFHEVYEYLRPFYDAGLDGVIIQDLGVFFAVGEWFPHLPRHISTQMTVTGSLGAAYLKSLGAKRIVPARELSLAEIDGNEKRNGYRGGNFYSWGSLLLLFRSMFVQQHSWREKRQPGKVRTALPPAIWNRKAGGEKIPLKPERYVYDRIAWAVDRSGD